MTDAQRLQQRLSSGALKSELRTVSESIHAARAMYKQIESDGMDAKDFFVHIGYLTPDLSALFTEPYVPGKESEIQAALSGQCCIVVGVVFGIRDWKVKNWLLGARPFLRTQLVTAAFQNWLDETFALNLDS